MSKVNTNVVIITGNLARDAVLRYTANQKPVLSFAVACNRTGADGQPAVDFFPVTLWGKSAEALEKYLVKGKGVLVKGRLQTRSYEANDGTKKSVTEIIADSFAGVELLGGGERPAQAAQTQQRRNDWNPMEVEAPAQPVAQHAQAPQADIPF